MSGTLHADLAGASTVNETPVRLTAGSFTLLVGVPLVVAALLGFALTGWRYPPVLPAEELLGMSVNPLLNLVHLAAGMILIVGGRMSEAAAWVVTMLATAAFGVLGLVGMWLVNTPVNPLALDAVGNGLHLGIAIVGTAVAATGRRSATGRGSDRAMASRQAW